MRGPQLLPLHLRLERTDCAHEAGLLHIQHLERVDLLTHESAHPLELLFKFRLRREVPGHADLLASALRPPRCLPPSSPLSYLSALPTSHPPPFPHRPTS